MFEKMTEEVPGLRTEESCASSFGCIPDIECLILCSRLSTLPRSFRISKPAQAAEGTAADPEKQTFIYAQLKG